MMKISITILVIISIFCSTCSEQPNTEQKKHQNFPTMKAVSDLQLQQTGIVISVESFFDGDPYAIHAKRKGIKKGMALTLIDIDEENEVFILQNSDGKKYGFSKPVCQRVIIED